MDLKINMIPVYQPYLNGREKIYVNQCLDSTWISSKGDFITKFEQQFAHYIHIKHATSVCNGTVALHLALSVLDLKPNDEIIVPSLTYIASVNTIAQTGAVPVFVDSLFSTWQMDINDVRRKITPRTKAIMAVHLYGLSCDMAPLLSLCKEYKLYLIEDCAEAFGSYYKNQHVGTFGDIAAFSFFGNKTITTGEGGMVVTNHQQFIEKAAHLKNQGVSLEREYWHDKPAYNYRMTNIAAAIGLAQLEQADIILEKKRQIALEYHTKLKNLPLKMHQETADTRHAYWMCSVLLDSASQRTPLREYLKSAGIETRPLFYPVHTLPPYLTKINFPVAESLSARGINLPSYPGLSKTEINHICTVIRDFFIT